MDEKVAVGSDDPSSPRSSGSDGKQPGARQSEHGYRQSTNEPVIHEKGIDGEQRRLHASFADQDSEWHAKMTRKLMFKIDIRLLPLLVAMYLLNFLDRNNLSQARLGTLEEDLGMKGTDFNLATSILFVGYILMQLPSNLIITRVTPSRYIGVVMFIWGAVSAAQGGSSSFTGLVVARFFLGFVEAPFFCGAIMMMSSWYTRKELAHRIAWFYSGTSLANAFGGLIGAGVIGNLNGSHGIAGWRWLFIIEGSITCGVAIIAFFVLPNYPSTTSWLKAEERSYAEWRLLEDTGEADITDASGLLQGLKLALKDYRVYVFTLLQHTSLLSQTFQYFFPSIVKTLGYGNIETLLITAPVWIATFLISLVVTYTSGRFGDRSYHILILQAVAVIGNIIVVSTLSIGARFFGMFLMPMGAVAAYQIIVAWVANSFPRPLVKRSACIAIANMFGNSATIYGSYMWSDADAPRYLPGGTATAVIGLVVMGLTWTLRTWLDRMNKGLAAKEEVDSEGNVIQNLHADDPDARAVGFSGTQDDRNPATNQYKGLVTFIADIRQARARELEEKRINKELANISIRKDLVIHNELYNCLALHAIANVGGAAMAEALGNEVHQLLISPASNPFVKKKAALTLLRLYRKHPSIVQAEWTERILALMDDPDFGVALSVTSLVMALAQDDPDQYRTCYNKAANRLKKTVLGTDCPADYLYYNVPCPWLQVKLLRLMQYYPSSDDSHIRELIRSSIKQILDAATEMPKNVQQNNAQNAVLFEAIKLVIHMDTEEELMVDISRRLGKFILGRETNVRYLGLEAMTHLASRGEALDPIKQHQKSIVASLRDRDITVRRQALDLLYSMCDQTNQQSIVTELLKHLQTADYAIREEMVLKIAVLAERYATDAQWYVDVSLRLLAIAGDHVSDEVWQRVIQIVTNNEGLQEYAARSLLRYVKPDQVHESLIRIGGYVLGEFGHLIAEAPGCSPIEQFMALYNKLPSCATDTRAIILSCFIKFINLFPEIKEQIMGVFQQYSDILDSELQQRACEYMAIAKLPNDELLRTVFDEMPPFPERASALLSRVRVKHTPSADKRATMIPNLTGAIPTGSNAPTTNGSATLNGSHDLEGLDMNGEDSKAINLASASHLSPGWEDGYYPLVLQAEGVLYEDAQVQIGLRSEYRTQMGCIILYFQNKSSYSIGSFTSTLDNPSSDTLKLDMRNLPDTDLAANAQSQQTIMFEAKNVFDEPPTIRISYLAGSLQAVTLKLPVLLHKYMEPADLTSEDFFKRWKQIGGAPREAQAIFSVNANSAITTSATRRTIQGLKWGLLEGVDPNPKNICGATVLHTTEGGNQSSDAPRDIPMDPAGLLKKLSISIKVSIMADARPSREGGQSPPPQDLKGDQKEPIAPSPNQQISGSNSQQASESQKAGLASNPSEHAATANAKESVAKTTDPKTS
ncbi:MAG: hypothetical protein Q9162_002955 [Coniocarpon cinnabarinum]